MAAPIAVPDGYLLENGARMSRAEFHRIYSQSEDLQHIELIERVVYMPASIRRAFHGKQQGIVLSWLDTYVGDRTDVEWSPPVTLILDDENEPEPDALLYSVGPGRLDADGYLVGAPELVVEIAASSRSRDLYPKKAAYERNGVREYMVWRVFEGSIDWFQLRESGYERREPGPDGIIESETFPGLRLDVEAMLAFDRARVLATLRPG